MSTIRGSASDIFTLLETAIEKIFDGQEGTGTGKSFKMLVEKLNEDEFQGPYKTTLDAGHMQRNIYNVAKRLVEQGNGKLGLAFTDPYLNRPCKYVHGKTFVQKYGKFEGMLYDVKKGIKDISDSNNKPVKIDIDRVYPNAKSAQQDIIKALEETKKVKLFMGRGNELQTETYHGLLQKPKKYSSVKILLPRTVVNDKEQDWVKAREKEIIEFDSAFAENILKQQINLTITFLQKTVKGNPNFKMRFFNAPHIGKIIVTDTYLFYYMMDKGSHGRECVMYRCGANSITYNSFERLFDFIWDNSKEKNEK